jgi:hypothetical protein
MGRAKDWEMEQEERGWWSVPGKHVCSECFEEEFLKKFVRDHAESSECDYCGLTAEELTGDGSAVIAAPFDSIMEIIAEGLQSEWNDADSEGIPYESAEGGYQAKTYDSYDLVWDYVCPANDDVAQEIIDALPDRLWVERGYWRLSEGQALWYGWRNICALVKHKNRYMFHLRLAKGRPAANVVPNVAGSLTRIETQEAEEALEHAPQHIESETNAPAEIGGSKGSTVERMSQLAPLTLVPGPIAPADFEEAIDEAQEGVSASRMLDAIGQAVEEVGLVRELPAGAKLFRGRVGPSTKPYRSSRSLGPPPQRKAVASRMSPAGVPMFYGALDEHTSIAETVLGHLKKGEVLNLGAFETLENMYLLDLTKVPPVPSLFSPSRHLRPTVGFLRAFLSDLSKPIKKDDRVHTEYVPTQIVTEYFRYSFHGDGGSPIRGILYPSSRAKGGTACVLFFTREECGAFPTGRFAELTKQWLRFVPRSHKLFRRKPRKPKRDVNPIGAGQLSPDI